MFTEIKDFRTDSKGTNYNGQKSTTISGIVCQAWGTNTPHEHSFKKLAAEKNYCRNPVEILIMQRNRGVTQRAQRRDGNIVVYLIVVGRMLSIILLFFFQYVNEDCVNN